MKGSIYKRKGSSRWYLSIDAGYEPDKNGKLKRVRDLAGRVARRVG